MKESNISLTLLFIAFLVLKLTNVIDWSWWWVTSPLWIPFTFAVLVPLITYFVLIWRMKNISGYKEKFEKIENKLKKKREPTKFQKKLAEITEKNRI